jgi:serine phosphatase RsbU (regulator of sigma subunit)
MLGPFLNPGFSSITLPLETEHRIVLITDGILEVNDSSGAEFGMERLRDFIESTHTLPAHEFVDALLDCLSGWSEHAIGSGQSDDITLLAIDVKGFSNAV